MRKLLATALISSLLFASTTLAIASSNKFADAQTGLTYTVYKPSTTLSMPGKVFQLIDCLPDEEQWLYAKYGGTVRYIEIMETKAGVK